MASQYPAPQETESSLKAAQPSSRRKLAIAAARGLHLSDYNAQGTRFAWHACHFFADSGSTKASAGRAKARRLRQPTRAVVYRQHFAFRVALKVPAEEDKVHMKEALGSAAMKNLWDGDGIGGTDPHFPAPQLKGEFGEGEFEEDRWELD
ncbi:hypothetical protein [Cereibacter sphaeroides]|uniref:hypothetical protein n=1 Tax=Cereibacter sphaeroides TaxID=1063 RepID=UPI00140F646C|nr:hypothetical protein [Cereibacter sphaeroides]